MSKFKVLERQGQIGIRCKLGSGESINSNEVLYFSNHFIRGIMQPTVEDASRLIYVGAQGVPLSTFLRQLISKDHFFMITAQIVELYKTGKVNGLDPNWFVLDPDNIIINPSTGEMYFIHSAIITNSPINSGFLACLNQIANICSFATMEDYNAAGEFVRFFNGLGYFAVHALENFIREAAPGTYAAIPHIEYNEPDTPPAPAPVMAAPETEFAPPAPEAPAAEPVMETPVTVYAPSSVSEPTASPASAAPETEFAPPAPEAPVAEPVIETPAAVIAPSSVSEPTASPASAAPEAEFAPPAPEAPAAEPAIETPAAVIAPSVSEPTASPASAAPETEFAPPAPEAPAAEPAIETPVAVIAPSSVSEPTASPASAAPETEFAPPAPEAPVAEPVIETPVAEPVIAAPAPEPEPVCTAKLRRRTTGDVIDISKPVFKLGKERAKVDYCITDNNTVSRIHAIITVKNGNCFISDNRSTNKTYINGSPVPVQTEIPLKDGDVIKLSNVEFDFIG